MVPDEYRWKNSEQNINKLNSTIHFHCDQVGFIPGMKGWSINVYQQTWYITLIDWKVKTIYLFQYLIQKKVQTQRSNKLGLNKVSIGGTYFNIMNTIYKNPTGNILFDGEKLKDFSLRSGTGRRYWLLPLSLNIVLEVLATAMKHKK